LLLSRQEGSIAIEVKVIGLDIAKNVFHIHDAPQHQSVGQRTLHGLRRDIAKRKAANSIEQASLLEQCYSGDYRAALGSSEKVLREAPHNARALFWKATSAQELAVGALTQMGTIAPDSARVPLLWQSCIGPEKTLAQRNQSIRRFSGREKRKFPRALDSLKSITRIPKNAQALEQLNQILKSDSSNIVGRRLRFRRLILLSPCKPEGAHRMLSMP
jgi:hypothetical protein